MRLKQFWKPPYISFGDADEELIPRNVRGKEIVVGYEYRSDSRLHDFKQANRPCTRSTRAEDEVRGSDCLGVALLAFLAIWLGEIPVVVRACVLNQNVGAIEPQIKHALAQQ